MDKNIIKIEEKLRNTTDETMKRLYSAVLDALKSGVELDEIIQVLDDFRDKVKTDMFFTRG